MCGLCIVTCGQGAGGCEELSVLGKGGWFLIHGYEALTWKSRTHDSITGGLHHELLSSILLDLIDSTGLPADWRAAFCAPPQVTSSDIAFNQLPIKPDKP